MPCFCGRCDEPHVAHQNSGRGPVGKPGGFQTEAAGSCRPEAVTQVRGRFWAHFGEFLRSLHRMFGLNGSRVGEPTNSTPPVFCFRAFACRNTQVATRREGFI